MPEGYCTVEDVRRALQKADLSGALNEDNNQAVVDAIVGQTDWLRSKTARHWYEPEGVAGDDHDLIPTAPRDHGPEENDIPSTPHSQHSQMFVSGRARYPLQTHGPYVRIRLDKHYAEEITALEVRDASGSYTDWVADSSKDEDDDYRLYVEPGATSSPSYIDLRAHSLPRLNHYAGAVRVTYSYGADGLSKTIRRAVALRAGAYFTEKAAVQIPDSVTLYNVEAKAQEMRDTADELLEAYR